MEYGKVDIRFGKRDPDEDPAERTLNVYTMDPNELEKYLADKYGSKIAPKPVKRFHTPTFRTRSEVEREQLRGYYIELLSGGMTRSEALADIHRLHDVSSAEMYQVHLKAWGFNVPAVEREAVNDFKRALPKQQYLNLRAGGLTRTEAMKAMGITYRVLKRWGLFEKGAEGKAMEGLKIDD